MNHTINFLDVEEVRPYVSKKTKSFLKRAVIATYVMMLMAFIVKYGYDVSIIREGKLKQSEWAGMEKEVDELLNLREQSARISKGYNTLLGWNISRVDWAEFLMYLASQLPGEPQNVQLNRLYFDEEIAGLRHQLPGAKPQDFYPLKREISLSMSGVLKADRPELTLVKFQRDMVAVKSGDLSIASMPLQYYNVLLNKDRKPTDLTEFFFTINLPPRVMAP
ncbi:hypothetical protein P3T73_04415 [Kiritimatiellota bacterium B12222]|nr:hypothetical protein P3T73_04415 [Kiritimatiellota bacterium B12222]